MLNKLVEAWKAYENCGFRDYDLGNAIWVTLVEAFVKAPLQEREYALVFLSPADQSYLERYTVL